MPEETQNNTLPEEQPPAQPAPAEEDEKNSAVFGPEGYIMLLIAGFFDILTAFCALLILLFGIGLILAKIVYVVALFTIGLWASSRGSTIPQKTSGGMKQKKINGFAGFLKRRWKRLAFRSVPLLGDTFPGMWVWTVWSELKN